MSNIEKSSLNTLDPIFVHSGFRTSSTWFWKKFRSFTDIIPYYEPFHEIISNINDYHPDSSYTNTWRSHHPSSAPYFMEYSVIPALKANPKLFNPSISLQTFIPSRGLEGELTSEEKAYIQCLIDNAHQYSKQPGFMFTRSLGRALAIKKSFGGKSIFLHRNLFHQWASYSGQNIRGNNYFIDRLEETVQFATHDPFLKALDEWFKDRQPAADNINTFILFIVFHLYIYISAFKSADVIINSTEISHNIKARQQTEADLFQLLGKEISLADARNVFDISFVNIKKPEILTETLDYFMKIISGIVSDQACLSFIEKARDDTITEWEKNEFYTKEMRSILLDKNIENSKIQQERHHELEIRDHRLHELDQAVQQRDAQLQELQQNVQQRDHHLHELNQAVQQRDTQLQELQQNVQQRDHNLHELIQTVQQRDAQLQELQQNVQQRDHNLH
ncbi:MAG: hypothetical protein ABF461_03970, partial [Zymomonas mobilis subsp. pomaceae]|uniref:hypothetical protein n=1 Tax=Zymomonas mobilis TaxID=542 RepID=UPI0039ED143E